MEEKLMKSIDSLIDECFAKAEVPAELKIVCDAPTTADAAIAEAPKGEDDKKKKDRPKELRDIETDTGNYDAAIVALVKVEEPVEAKQVIVPAPLNKADMDELMAFRAEKLAKAEEMKKAEVVQAQEELIKSVVERTAAKYEAKIEALQKSVQESAALVKAVANTPQRPKSITSVSVLEKSMSPENNKQESFSKAEMLNKAEELFMKGELTDYEVIELENNGYIYNSASRAKLEKALNS